ncbi:MAG: sigma-70 family RNA polymerase sigma factor [Myxococcales bacterium]|nr:sigma-70 family RNA polymerase sigma factor [Myxococcales bacterium]
MRRWALLETADGVAADEVVQEALLRFVRFAHTWDGVRPFGTWLRTIVRNVARSRRPRREVAEREPSVPSRLDRALDLDSTARAALAALSELPVRQREVLDLCDWQGRTPTQAAHALELDPSTVRVHLHRGRKRLREILDAQGRDVVALLREES